MSEGETKRASRRRFALRALGAAALGALAAGAYLWVERKVGLLVRLQESLVWLSLPLVAAAALRALATPGPDEPDDAAPLAGLTLLVLPPGLVGLAMVPPRFLYPPYFAAALAAMGWVGSSCFPRDPRHRHACLALLGLGPGVLGTVAYGGVLALLASLRLGKVGGQHSWVPVLLWAAAYALLAPLTVWLGRKLEARCDEASRRWVRGGLLAGLLVPATIGFLGAGDWSRLTSPFSRLAWGGTLGALVHLAVYAWAARRAPAAA